MASKTFTATAAMALAFSLPALAAVFPNDVFKRAEIEHMSLEERGAMDASLLWDAGEVPYILQQLPHDLSNSIRDAMRQWEQNTCIRFVPKTNQGAWVTFKKYNQGCYAQIMGAPASGEVIVNLDYPSLRDNVLSLGTYKGCMENGIPGHELGHVIGLAHEHQRPDRDQYIRVWMENVDQRDVSQFEIYEPANTSLPFDYNSIMLYDTKAFSRNNRATISTITDKPIDPWDTPTVNDLKAVNNAYGCEEYFTRTVPKCRAGSIPSDGNRSSYSFILDKYTEQYMRENNYTHVAAHQECRANTLNQGTDNWGFNPLHGWGPRSQYTVSVDRCKKDFDRHASRYEVALCKGDNEDACDIKCGTRRVCPFDASGKQVDSKAIDIVDDTLWVCHPH
ncbi:zinc transporter ZIP9 [Colletotrichum spaethianum]|uniref:Metalloendopeptidase n=1 Tax=Colletotrichum spaethianum TaxID=700344 RepID=A0AA37LA71_9PEZI|nr:zinc transporter ZIP9 [Colletotrichum spaethianum]GKT44702.1 zinc transporter ZIP9 [Colletotrichum spaethianum]